MKEKGLLTYEKKEELLNEDLLSGESGIVSLRSTIPSGGDSKANEYCSLRLPVIFVCRFWDHTESLGDNLFYAYNFITLYKKKEVSLTPLNTLRKALSLALKDSAEAFVLLLSK